MAVRFPEVGLLEELLAAHAGAIGRDFAAYRGHCYRVLQFAAAQLPQAELMLGRLAVTAVFHDIGIWTHGTFDYLEPSVEVASAYLAECGRRAWTEEVAEAIRGHHKVRPLEAGTFAEAFRRADWVDVSMGALRLGVERETIREAYAKWPAAGFHWRLVEFSWERAKKHPFSPLPMLRF
jgi:hypothetical protein